MRMRTTWLVTALLAAALPAPCAEPPKVQWLDTLSGLGGAYGCCVAQTADNGYVAVGSTGVDSLGSNMYFYYYVARIDSAGDTLWTAIFARESVGHEDGTPRGVLQTRDGGSVILGSDKGADYREHPYIVKLDSAGTLLWQSLLAGDTFERVSAVQRAADGGYVLAGPLDPRGLYLMKIDSVGTRLWCRTLDDGATRRPLQYPTRYPLAAASDGGFVTASRNDTAAIVMRKVDSVGAEVWHRTCGFDTTARIGSIASAADGGFVMAGYAKMKKQRGRGLIYLLRVDSLGQRQWCRYFGRGKSPTCKSVSQTKDGGFVMTGSVSSAKHRRPQSDAFVLRTDRNGNEIWYTVISPSTAEVGDGSCVQQTSDGDYVVCGTLGWRVGHRFHARLFVAKLAPERRR